MINIGFRNVFIGDTPEDKRNTLFEVLQSKEPLKEVFNNYG